MLEIGKYNEQGEFEGPGKLEMKFKEKTITSSPVLRIENGTCVRQNLETDSKIVSKVVGTFRNGQLEGTAKVKYSDNTTLISYFEQGCPFGMKRTWTSKNDLHEVFYWAGYVKSIAWIRSYDYLIGMNVSFIRDDAYSSLAVIVPLSEFQIFKLASYFLTLLTSFQSLISFLLSKLF